MKPANKLPVEVALMLTSVVFVGYNQQNEKKFDYGLISSHTADN